MPNLVASCRVEKYYVPAGQGRDGAYTEAQREKATPLLGLIKPGKGVAAFRCGADEGARTPDLLITNQLLYRLSYIGKQNGDAGVSVASGAGDGNRTHALSLGS
jgi:hypothetical protein